MGKYLTAGAGIGTVAAMLGEVVAAPFTGGATLALLPETAAIGGATTGALGAATSLLTKPPRQPSVPTPAQGLSKPTNLFGSAGTFNGTFTGGSTSPGGGKTLLGQ